MVESFEIETLRSKTQGDQVASVTRLKSFTFLAFGFCISLLGISILFLVQIPCATSISAVVFSVITLIGVFVDYFWVRAYLKAIQETSALYTPSVSYRRTAYTIFDSAVRLALSVFALVFSFVSYPRLASWLLALHSDPETWTQMFGNHTLNFVTTQLQWIYLGLIITLFLFIIYFANAALVAHRCLPYVNRGVSHFLYFSNLFLVAAATILIISSTYALGYANYDEIYTRYPMWLVHFIRAVGFALLAIAVIVLVANIRRSRKLYGFSATILGLLMTVLLVLTAVSYRDSSNIRTELAKSEYCFEALKRVSYTDLNEFGCPIKFFRTADDKNWETNCPTTQLGVVWEDERNVTNSDKQQQLACLNGACCNILGELFGEDFLFLSTVALAATIIVAFVFLASGELWKANWMEYNIKPRKTDYVWMGISILFVLAAFGLTITDAIAPNKIFNRPYVLDFGTLDFTRVDPTTYTAITSNDIGDQACYSIQNASAGLNLTECGSTCYYSVRFLGENGTFSVKSQETLTGVSIGDNSQKAKDFPSAKSTDGYLNLTGTVTGLQAAFKSHLYFCPSAPGLNHNIKIIASQKQTASAALVLAAVSSVTVTSDTTTNKTTNTTNATNTTNKTNATNTTNKTNATNTTNKTNATANTTNATKNATVNVTVNVTTTTGKNTTVNATINTTKNATTNVTNATNKTNATVNATNATKNATNVTINVTKNATNATTNATNKTNVTNATKNATNVTTNVTKNATNATTNVTKNATNATTNVTKNATTNITNATKNATNVTTNATKNATTNVTNATKNVTTNATNATKNVTVNVTNATKNATNVTINVTKNATNATTNVTKNATNATNVTKNATNVTNATKNATNVTNVTKNVTNATKNATNVTNATKNATNVTNATKNVTNATKNATNVTNATKNVTNVTSTNATKNVTTTNVTKNVTTNATNATKNATNVTTTNATTTKNVTTTTTNVTTVTTYTVSSTFVLNLETTETQTVTGQIVTRDTAGIAKALAGVQVALLRYGATLGSSAVTNATGWFQITVKKMRGNLAYMAVVSAKKDGYIPLQESIQLGGVFNTSLVPLGRGLEMIPINTTGANYGAVSIQVYDVKTLNTLDNVQINLFNISDSSNPASSALLQTQTSSSAGYATFTYLNKNYYPFNISSTRYKGYSDYAAVSSNEKFLSIPLVPKSLKSVITIVYENLGGVSLTLAANFVYNSTTQCLADPINNACSGMNLIQSNSQRSVLQFTSTGDFDYIIYVKKFDFVTGAEYVPDYLKGEYVGANETTTNVTTTTTTNVTNATTTKNATTNATNVTKNVTNVTTTNVTKNVTNATNATKNVTNVTKNATNVTTNVTKNVSNVTNATKNVTNASNVTKNVTNVTKNATNVTNATKNASNVTNATKNVTNATKNVTVNVTNATKNATNVTTNATKNATNVTNGTKNVTNVTNATKNVTNATKNVTNVTNATKNATNVTINVTKNVTNVTNATNATKNVTNATNATKNVTNATNATKNVTVNATNATKNVTNVTNATKNATTNVTVTNATKTNVSNVTTNKTNATTNVTNVTKNATVNVTNATKNATTNATNATKTNATNATTNVTKTNVTTNVTKTNATNVTVNATNKTNATNATAANKTAANATNTTATNKTTTNTTTANKTNTTTTNGTKVATINATVPAGANITVNVTGGTVGNATISGGISTGTTVTANATNVTVSTSKKARILADATNTTTSASQEANGVIRVYVDGYESQVIKLNFPQIVYLKSGDDFQWLAFCMSGKQGPTSLRPLNVVRTSSGTKLDAPLATLCAHY